MESSYVLDSRFRGNDTPGLACRRRGELLHSAKVLQVSVVLWVGSCSIFILPGKEASPHGGSNKKPLSIILEIESII